MKLFKIFTAFSAMLMCGCLNSPVNNYIGHWKAIKGSDGFTILPSPLPIVDYTTQFILEFDDRTKDAIGLDYNTTDDLMIGRFTTYDFSIKYNKKRKRLTLMQRGKDNEGFSIEFEKVK